MKAKKHTTTVLEPVIKLLRVLWGLKGGCLLKGLRFGYPFNVITSYMLSSFIVL